MNTRLNTTEHREEQRLGFLGITPGDWLRYCLPGAIAVTLYGWAVIALVIVIGEQ